MRIVNYLVQKNNLWLDSIKSPLKKRYLKIAYLFVYDLLFSIKQKIINKQQNYYIANKRDIYISHLTRLAKKRKNNQKIKVMIFVAEISQWSCDYIYEKLKESGQYDIEICLLPPHYSGVKNAKKYIDDATEFFRNKSISVRSIFTIDPESRVYVSQINKKFCKQFDVVIYQSPWRMDYSCPLDFINHALLLYIPYCFYMLESDVNYKPFHSYMWKYFSESPLHVSNYLEKYNATNVIGLGNPKLDSYRKLKRIDQGKKIVIYAPHWSIPYDNMPHTTSTFKWSANFLLKFAQSNIDKYLFVFKPHPKLRSQLEISKYMSRDQIEEYYQSWSDIGKVNIGADYYQDFIDSDLLVTDSISFLAEYLPSKNPVIRLIPKEELQFNSLGQKIIENYYNANDINDLSRLLEQLLVKENDPMQSKRIDSIKCLGIDENKSVSEKILEYLEQEINNNI